MSEEEKPDSEDYTCRYEIQTLDLEGGTSTDETGIYDPISGTYKPDSRKPDSECGICKLLRDLLDRQYSIDMTGPMKHDPQYYRNRFYLMKLLQEHGIDKHGIAIF